VRPRRTRHAGTVLTAALLTGPAALTGCAPPATGTGAHPGAYAGAKPLRAGRSP
jgi:hypothetical protein